MEIKPVTLIILDGWGMASANAGNAITLAKTPNFNRYWLVYPHTFLKASGEAVGLPPGEVGNSETGHLNIGAGNIVYQDLPRINMAIAEGTFFKMPSLLLVVNHVRQHQSALHLMGLISDAGVHSNLSHLFALLRFAKEQGLSRVFLHLFTDGRDSSPTSSISCINAILSKTGELGIGQIATLIGRYFAMDRDLRWDRTQKAYDLLVSGKGTTTHSPQEAIQASYDAGKTDEFIEPICCLDPDNQPVGLIKDNDGVIFFNFRVDRPRQLARAFVAPDFENTCIKRVSFDPYAERYGLKQYEAPHGTTTFQRQKVLKNLFFVTMTEYEKNLPIEVVFPPIMVKMPIGRILAEAGVRQLHIAETEKFPHITYFLNGGRAEKFPGEDQVLINSPRVATYDLQPEMSLRPVTDELIKRIRSKTYKFIIVNFANPDMVGHTGVLEAGIKACEITDQCLGEVVKATTLLGGTAVITADHGNVEEMIDLQTGQVDTKHSHNPVPLIIINPDNGHGGRSLPRGILADIAPTVLSQMGINRPSSMSGRDLLKIV